MLDFLYDLASALCVRLGSILMTVMLPVMSWILHGLEIVLVRAQAAIFPLSELLSELSGAEPCRIYPARNSAILIVGGEDGVGRSVTMKFSELGFTVFALCAHRAQGTSSPISPSTDVSSQLLYAWHHRKERSPHIPWGLVAPIPLDMSSKAGRKHAYETIKAYCSDHALQLVAFINLPSSFDDTGSVNAVSRFLPLCIAKEDALKDAMEREIIEPVLIIQDYVKMLAQSTGRVIIVSDCSDNPTTCLGLASRGEIREAICRALYKELEPLGLRVSSIASGPVAIPNNVFPVSAELDRRNICSKLTDSTILRAFSREISIQQAVREALRPFAVREEEIFALLLRIVQSKYPKRHHLIGLHPIVMDLLDLSPLSVRSLVRRFM